MPTRAKSRSRSRPRKNSRAAASPEPRSMQGNTALNANMLGGLFDNYNFGTLAAMSHTLQLSSDTAFNPITLNRILISHAYMTMGIIQTFIDQPVEDAFRGGVDIQTDELDEEDLSILQDSLWENKDYKEIKDTMKWAKLFGGSGLIINTDQEPTDELDIGAIDDKTPVSFIAADRWELTYNYLTEAVDAPFSYYGQRIHKSRVMKVLGKEAPSFIRKRLGGWGMSDLERVIRDINSYLKNQDVIYELLDEAKIDVWRINGFNTALLTADAQAKITERLQLASRVKNFQNATIMDSEDEYEQKQITFGGLAELMLQNRIGVAAAVRMPMSKIFGLSATGFSSGEDDIENYNALIESEVRAKAREILHMVIRVRCKQMFGFIPEHFDVNFKPLRILTAEQMENTKDKKFNRASAMLAQGALTGPEFFEYLKREDVFTQETEVGKGKRELEPPQTPTMDLDLPQKVVKTKDKIKTGRNQ